MSEQSCILGDGFVYISSADGCFVLVLESVRSVKVFIGGSDRIGMNFDTGSSDYQVFSDYEGWDDLVYRINRFLKPCVHPSSWKAKIGHLVRVGMSEQFDYQIYPDETSN
jgi:hypothetical protein